jgi:hypothetical protein
MFAKTPFTSNGINREDMTMGQNRSRIVNGPILGGRRRQSAGVQTQKKHHHPEEEEENVVEDDGEEEEEEEYASRTHSIRRDKRVGFSNTTEERIMRRGMEDEREKEEEDAADERLRIGGEGGSRDNLFEGRGRSWTRNSTKNNMALKEWEELAQKEIQMKEAEIGRLREANEELERRQRINESNAAKREVIQNVLN